MIFPFGHWTQESCLWSQDTEILNLKENLRKTNTHVTDAKTKLLSDLSIFTVNRAQSESRSPGLKFFCVT